MKTAHRTASTHKRKYQADPSAIYRVMGRAQGFTPDEQAQLNLPVMLAVDAIAHGRGEEGDFHTLAAAVNVAMICAERIDPLVERTCIDARDALMRMLARKEKHGTYGFDGPGYSQVLECVDVYQQLTSLLTGGQLKAAMTECIKRMRSGEYLEVTR
jgi:hypothetical protein